MRFPAEMRAFAKRAFSRAVRAPPKIHARFREIPQLAKTPRTLRSTRGPRRRSIDCDQLGFGTSMLAVATHSFPSLMPTMVRPIAGVKIAYSLSLPELERFGNLPIW